MPPVIAGAALVGGASIVAGGIGAAFAATGLIGGIAQLGGSLILSGAAKLLTGGSGGRGASGRTLSFAAPVTPREVCYGAVRKGGVIVFVHETGSSNRFLHLVIALAGHEVESIGATYFDGEEVIAADGTVSDKYDGFVIIEKRLGIDDQEAFSQLQADAPDKWTTSHRLDGIAAVYLRLRFNNDLFPRGLPDISFDVEGKNDIYDPRTETTGYTANAALCLADYMAGDLYGLGTKIGAEDGIAEADLIEAANICDEDVTLAGSGTEKRYTSNGVVSTDQTPKAIVEAMLTAMGGKAIWPGGAWKLRAAAYRTPSVTLTPDDVREDGMTVQTRISRADNFNGVRGRFVSPENNWQPDDFPAVQSAVYVAEDGGEESWRDLSLPFTTSAATAQRLAKIELERVRRQITLSLAGKLAAWKAAAGDTAEMSYERWGWSDKAFEVSNASLGLAGDTLVPELTLRETAAGIYAWDSTEEQIYAAAPPTLLPSPFNVPPTGEPQLEDELYETRDGVKVLVRITWSPSPSGFVTEYQVQARRVEDETGAATGEDWRTFGRTDQTDWEIRDAAAGLWQARVKPITTLGVSGPYSTGSRNILGLGAIPADIEDLTIQTAGGIALLKWTPSADLDVRIGGRIVIRHSASGSVSWANSVSLDEVPGNAGVAAVPLKPGTYLLRARDNGGRQSAVPATVSTSGAQAVGFANLATLDQAPTFGGTKTNCEVVSSALRLTTLGTPGLYEFALGSDLGSVKTVRVRSDIDVAALNLSATIDDRTEPIDSWPDFDDTDGAEVDCIVEMRTTPDDPAGTPTWSGWSRVDALEIEARGFEFRARLTSASLDYNLVVSGLSVTLDEVA